jgi:N-acetylneuraminic acid mutarotase
MPGLSGHEFSIKIKNLISGLVLFKEPKTSYVFAGVKPLLADILMKRTPLFRSLIALFALGLLPVSAQVPQLIQFQGRIAVGSTNFEGAGQFKFALVNADGTTTYWNNDGSEGAEPAAAVTLPVVKGLYSVLLGDATLPNMATLPSTVFNHGDVHLRVWFNDGVNGFHQLSPDQRIAAVGYAMMAAHVADGSITQEKITPGAVGAAQLAPDAVMGSLSATGLGLVPSGAVMLSEQEDNPALLEAGYVKVGSALSNSGWKELAEPDTVRIEGATSVWTGSELLYWGGMDWLEGYLLNSGERYNPSTNRWSPMSEVNAPSPRFYPEVIWTGTEMIVWGGMDEEDYTKTGARYNPATDTWAPMATSGAPLVEFPKTLWTGSKMLVWGGLDVEQWEWSNRGALYNPQTNTWSAISRTRAPSARELPIVVWTGTEMIVWGGFDEDGLPNDTGARYNPETNTWSTMATVGSPDFWYDADLQPVATWTGTEMLIWGMVGYDDDDGLPIFVGARYNPTTNAWVLMSAEGGAKPLWFDRYEYAPQTAWTGTEWIIWFGKDNGGGACYQPATDTWTPISRSYAPNQAPGYLVTSVWTGKELLLWGGWFTNTGEYNKGSRYNPATHTWTKLSSVNAPSNNYAEYKPGSVWTGSQLIILPTVYEFVDPPYSYTPSGSDFLYIYQRP